jgi:chromosome segregation ATPase
MKWTDQILNTLRGWFSLNEEATESEIHAEMEKVTDLNAYRENVRSEIKNQLESENKATIEALQSQFDKLTADLQSNKSALDAEQKKNTEAQNRINELEKMKAEHTKIKSGEGGQEGKKTTDMPIWEKFKEEANNL